MKILHFTPFSERLTKIKAAKDLKGRFSMIKRVALAQMEDIEEKCKQGNSNYWGYIYIYYKTFSRLSEKQ